MVFAYQSLLARIIRTFVPVVKRTKGKEKRLVDINKAFYMTILSLVLTNVYLVSKK